MSFVVPHDKMGETMATAQVSPMIKTAEDLSFVPFLLVTLLYCDICSLAMAPDDILSLIHI